MSTKGKDYKKQSTRLDFWVKSIEIKPISDITISDVSEAMRSIVISINYLWGKSMQQITILLSSALTLLLVTGNNASYASPHIRDFSPKKFQGKKPNMNAFKGQERRGNVFKPSKDGRITKPHTKGSFRECSALALYGGLPCPAVKSQKERTIFKPSKDGRITKPHTKGSFRECSALYGGHPCPAVKGKTQ